MMAAMPLAGLAPARALALEDADAAGGIVRSGAAGLWKLQILTPHEWKSVCVLSDWIVPADEVSASATDAGVPAFIDDWLNFQRGYELTGVREGLVWLDDASKKSFGRDFVSCTAEQQRTMLDRIAWPEKAQAGDAEGVGFFNLMRDLVLSGFYTSETGTRDLPYLGNEPQNGWHGCPEKALKQLGV
jgi:hypothetical protein